ncbi:radical SAM protein [Candidatus Bathyarchaeota archaeon]|jgi:hypothetical protein|nr:MAG: radical SAM protein [Candidatus Bathyarchaeota archaeon]
MVENLDTLLEASRQLGWKNFGKKIVFYAPSFAPYTNTHFHASPWDFPSISITGTACALKCKHCDGRVLGTMIPATTPETLLEVCQKIKAKGGRGCLISGGCQSDGSVPLHRFLPVIKQIKDELGLTLVIHTGLVDDEMAKALADARIDAALLDIIGSQETIEELYNLNVSIDAYEISLKALSEAGIPFVPHVLVGLHYGTLKGELGALEMISRHNPHGVVIIALTPLKETLIADVLPPPAEDIAWVLAKARLMMPDIPIALGCMRPKGAHRRKTDVLAVRAGINAIAYPVAEAMDLAESMNIQLKYSTQCCSQIYEDFVQEDFKQ